MLTNIQLTNAQKDTFQQACLVVNHIEWEEVEAAVTKKVMTYRTGEEYDLKETKEESEDAGFSRVVFGAQYWSSMAKMQAGLRPYILEDTDGCLEFTIDINQEWEEKFNSIQGTDKQKMFKFCEMWLTEVVLPGLRA